MFGRNGKKLNVTKVALSLWNKREARSPAINGWCSSCKEQLHLQRLAKTEININGNPSKFVTQKDKKAVFDIYIIQSSYKRLTFGRVWIYCHCLFVTSYSLIICFPPCEHKSELNIRHRKMTFCECNSSFWAKTAKRYPLLGPLKYLFCFWCVAKSKRSTMTKNNLGHAMLTFSSLCFIQHLTLSLY